MPNKNRPELFFAVELPLDPLTDLFEREGILDQLRELNAGICLGILDFRPQRAEVVKRLNNYGIPVNAWLLLPEEQGYWFNLDNAHAAFSRYTQFLTWTQKNNLRWEAIGLDIEPDVHFLKELIAHPIARAPRLLKNLFSTSRLSSVSLYNLLATQIRKDGYEIETYQLPFIIDERFAHSTVLQKTLGLVDIPADREILMLYSSYFRRLGPGFLWSYANQAGCVGVGSTGGGGDLTNVLSTPPLTWDELNQDLLYAYQVSPRIFIFSLEGCVNQNFLERIGSMDWNASLPLPVRSAQRIGIYRRLSQFLLSLLSRPVVFLVGLLFGWLLFRRIFRLEEKRTYLP
jgi:hypothetical protein